MAEEPPPEITLNHLGIGEIDIEVNKLAKMVETWVDVRLEEYDKKTDTKLKEMKESIQDVIKNFNEGVLKYLKSGLIVSINVGLIGFGWFLKGILS